ncbi:MAG: yajC [Verrucomicrobiaceae bacterium]|nr:yajC [Verrucomicrobiaceae bacterium]
MIAPLSHFLAQAADAGAPAPGGLLGNPMVFMVLMFVMMYFVLIRPQRNRQKQAEALVKALKVGDEVVTIGGIHGVITSIKDKTAMIRIADATKVEFDRSAIVNVVKKEEPATVAS